MNRLLAVRKALCAGLSLAGLMTSVSSASAAWNNVFQVTCWNCQTRTNTSYYSPPVAAPPMAMAPMAAPVSSQPNCSTSYVQRSYYEPVTSYERKIYYESVTSYRTSYYYEPTTNCRTSYYYDACSSSYKPQSTQEVSYSLKAQQCPVTNYVERCYYQPVTSYRASYYYQPVTQCCTTTVGDPVAVPGGAPMAAPMPASASPPSQAISPAPVGIPGTSAPPLAPLSPAPAVGEQHSPGVSYNPRALPLAPAPVAPLRPTVMRPDRLTSLPGSSASPVRGQVLAVNSQPLGNAQVTFVSAQSSQRVVAQADVFGRFQADLPSGVWQVFVPSRHPGESAQLAQTVRVGAQNDLLRLVSR